LILGFAKKPVPLIPANRLVTAFYVALASTGKELKISPIFWLCAAFLATSVDSKVFFSFLV